METATDLKSHLRSEVTRLGQQADSIRQHKVDALKRLIDSGNYQVNLDKLADRLVNQL